MKNSAFGPDVIVLPDDKDNSIKTFKQIIPVTIHHFYVTEEIGEVDRYLDLINTLKTAEPHDTIFIYLNTPGGILNTVIQIISAMKQANATVITALEGEVCSAGTLLFLAGDKYIINPNTTFMVHNYSGGIFGKGNEIQSNAKYRDEYAKKLMNDMYKDFLTAQEIQEVLDGRDIWLHAEEVIKRLSDKEKILNNDIMESGSKLPQMLALLLEEEAAEKRKAANQESTPATPPKPTKKKKAS